MNNIKNVKGLIESFNKQSEQTRYGALIVAVILIVLLDAVFVAMPQLGAIGNTNSQIKDTSENIRQVLSDYARIGLLKKDLAATRGRFTALSDKVRTTMDVSAILGTISNVANEYGVAIDQLDPEWDGKKALAKAAGAQYYTLPVLVKARCGYHNFGRFLSRLENDNLFFIIKDFIIQNEGSDPRVHEFSLTIDLILADRAVSQKL
ncbi:MAG: type 4a pilus biogenesis protein PilO [Candidatus Omnitrophica bacterium]|nr:type 4a pilus biogenesis protein PilO [Candidatus Omnitrophota bacterium]MDE2008553.1 type 4a pilus biogenesis protein PilO [Candidatus Omnitrophota bacterium]MDE2214019.1 type 4a pilus biogenesis protein PilO [Candidatus Omnitrophota bacterium]MDE2231003.1 type 4a pilus biogenesis protein PilO [Candidatus Omnitrophota bacterium]